MPPVIPKSFSWTVGQALLNCLNAVAQNGGTSAGAEDLTITWDSGLDTRGPGFRADFTNPTTHNPVAVESCVLGTTGSSWPLAYVTGTTSASFQATFSIGAGGDQAGAWAEAAADALQDCVETMCGADTIADFDAEFTRPGRTVSAVGVSHRVFTAGEMLQQFQVVVQNTAVTASGPDSIGGIAMSMNLVALQTTAVYVEKQQQDPLPFDLDVAINNGANIYSVISKTFTEPGT